MSYLTLDIGTTNWKAIVFSENCTPLFTAKRPAQLIDGEDGLSYYDPEVVWQSILDMLRQVNVPYPLSQLNAICVTSMGEAVVPIGADGHPAFSIIPWFDTRSIDQAEQIRNTIGKDRIFEITGSEAGAIFSLPKILWMRDHYPHVFQKARKWLQMADFINYRLCGQFYTDPSLACRTLAFDLTHCKWSGEILSPFGLDSSVFPEVVPSGSVIGTVSSLVSAETGLPPGLPVVMGGHDHPIASIAGAVFEQNLVFDSSGTAEPFLHISNPGQLPSPQMQGHRCTRHPMPDRFINWGGIVSSGVCIDWAVQRFTSHHDFSLQQAELSYNDLFNLAAKLPAGSQGLMFHPSLRGSGAPLWDARSKGALLGLTSEHTSVHILRAVLEGLSYQAKQIILMHEQISGCSIDTIRCMGGGSRISLWQQIKADVTGCVVEVGEVNDATPMGAAILCAYAQNVGSLEDIARELQPSYHIFEPNIKNSQYYKEFFALYQRSSLALEETNHQLDALTRQ